MSAHLKKPGLFQSLQTNLVWVRLHQSAHPEILSRPFGMVYRRACCWGPHVSWPGNWINAWVDLVPESLILSLGTGSTGMELLKFCGIGSGTYITEGWPKAWVQQS